MRVQPSPVILTRSSPLDCYSDAFDPLGCYTDAFESPPPTVLSAPRVPLCRRIDERCEAMLQVGLLEEVSSQLEQNKLLPSCPAGRAIGYRQTMAYLLRDKSSRGDATALKEYVEGFTAASRRYAAQQTKVGAALSPTREKSCAALERHDVRPAPN